MRQLNKTVEEFSQELEKSLENRYSTVCTSFGRVDPKQLSIYLDRHYLYKFKLKGYSAKQLKLLAIGSWFYNEQLAAILRADLREKINTGSLDFETRLEILPYLESKEHAMNFLVTVDDKFSASDWYGNIFKQLEELLFNVKFLLFKPNSKGVKRYTGYCRGYKSSKPGKTIEKQVLENNNFMSAWKSLKQSDSIVTLLHQQAMSFYLERDFKNYKIILKTLKEYSLERESLLNFFGMSGPEAIKRMIEFEKRSEEIHSGKFLKTE